MADVMRAATPINNRNIIQPAKEHRDSAALPFDFQDLSKVKQTSAQSEMLGQNNVIKENKSATVLYQLLKNPETATSFLKNIFFLREIVGLLPLNNETSTEEMQQLMNKLILNPEEIPEEMARQENISTMFKGEFFDTLRQILSGAGLRTSQIMDENFLRNPSEIPTEQTASPQTAQSVSSRNEILQNEISQSEVSQNEAAQNTAVREHPTENAARGGASDFNLQAQQKEVRNAVVNLLKAINNENSKGEVLNAVKNNLNYLKESFPESSPVAQKLGELAERLEGQERSTGEAVPLSPEEFISLKSEILKTLGQVQQSVLYGEDAAKTVAMTKYNLSRYNSGESLVPESFSRLLSTIGDGKLKEKLTMELVKYLETPEKNTAARESKTMSALAEILEKQSENPELKLLNSESIDKIVQGLLTSPCNFTPLLHYVIPVETEDVQSMAEIWVNPNGEEDVEGAAESGRALTHMLVVFEIDGIGKFETELFVENKSINLSVLCPPEYADSFKSVNADIRKACENTGYRFSRIDIGELKEQRSLIDVFRSLPTRRTGINVTI